MIRWLRVAQMTRRPQSALGGITYLEMSLKLNSTRVDEAERCGGEETCLEFGRRPPIDIREELDRRDRGTSPSNGMGVDGFGDDETDKLVNPDGEVAIRASGTWYTILGPCLTSKTA